MEQRRTWTFCCSSMGLRALEPLSRPPVYSSHLLPLRQCLCTQSSLFDSDSGQYLCIQTVICIATEVMMQQMQGALSCQASRQQCFLHEVLQDHQQPLLQVLLASTLRQQIATTRSRGTLMTVLRQVGHQHAEHALPFGRMQ